MATPGYAKGIKIYECSICKKQTTMVCTDCNKPFCIQHIQFSMYRDKKYRCSKDFKKYVEKYGSGIKIKE